MGWVACRGVMRCTLGDRRDGRRLLGSDVRANSVAMGSVGKFWRVVIVAVAGCTPPRLPPTVSIVDVAPQRDVVDSARDELPARDEAPPASAESVDLTVARQAPGRDAPWMHMGGPEQRVVMRGGQEVLIGEPDRL